VQKPLAFTGYSCFIDELFGVVFAPPMNRLLQNGQLLPSKPLLLVIVFLWQKLLK
jgi:hypothetical protein